MMRHGLNPSARRPTRQPTVSARGWLKGAVDARFREVIFARALRALSQKIKEGGLNHLCGDLQQQFI